MWYGITVVLLIAGIVWYKLRQLELVIYRCDTCGGWIGEWEIETGKCLGHRMRKTSRVSLLERIQIVCSWLKRNGLKKQAKTK